jgi:aminoglycoside phosphotransferase (APT) family kinase protein
MLYDMTVTDACFTDGREPEDIEDIIAWARQRLGVNHTRPWRLVSARRKLGKTLFEVEEQTSSGSRRLIGKLGKADRADTLFNASRDLRDNGFRPPAMFIVTDVIGYAPERGFVLQEKAAGLQASDVILKKPEFACSTAVSCAQWLATLHQCGVPAPEATSDQEELTKWVAGLKAALPKEEARIDSINAAIRHELAQPATELTPCHGDFHPMNIFIADKCVTGIDIDKFCRREPESDVAYFLSQTAAFDFFENSSFDKTADARQAFVDAYETAMAGAIRRRRAAMYMAMAFLKNLHFEIVLLETGRSDYVEPWLSSAAAAVVDDNLFLTP